MAQPEFMDNLGRVNSAKERIKQALIKQNQNPSDNIEDYSALIENIEGALTPQEYQELDDLASEILGINDVNDIGDKPDDNEGPLNPEF